ncbi:MAG: hypothetical protein AAGB34_07440 [Planctomycetota bacterium]
MTSDDMNFAPPTDTTAPVAIDTRPTWPIVIGIIAIILAILGLIMNSCMIGMNFMSDSFISLMESSGDPTVGYFSTDQYRNMVILSAVLVIPDMLLSPYLIFASILLIRRKASGVKHLTIWLYAFLIFMLIRIPIGIWSTLEMAQGQRDYLVDNNLTSSQPSFFTSDAYYLMSTLVGYIFVLAFPVFLAIWLLLPKVKASVARLD